MVWQRWKKITMAIAYLEHTSLTLLSLAKIFYLAIHISASSPTDFSILIRPFKSFIPRVFPLPRKEITSRTPLFRSTKRSSASVYVFVPSSKIPNEITSQHLLNTRAFLTIYISIVRREHAEIYRPCRREKPQRIVGNEIFFSKESRRTHSATNS